MAMINNKVKTRMMTIHDIKMKGNNYVKGEVELRWHYIDEIK